MNRKVVCLKLPYQQSHVKRLEVSVYTGIRVCMFSTAPPNFLVHSGDRNCGFKISKAPKKAKSREPVCSQAIIHKYRYDDKVRFSSSS